MLDLIIDKIIITTVLVLIGAIVTYILVSDDLSEGSIKIPAKLIRILVIFDLIFGWAFTIGFIILLWRN